MRPVVPAGRPAAGRKITPALDPGRSTRVRGYAVSLAILLACTGVSALFHETSDLGSVVSVYLLGVMLVAAWLGRGPAVMASIFAAAIFDFMFVAPLFGFIPVHVKHLLIFLVMLAVALTVSTLASRLRGQLIQAREREHRTAILYGLARDLARAGQAQDVAEAVDRHVQALFGCRAIIFATSAGELRAVGRLPVQLAPQDIAAARSAAEHGQAAGASAQLHSDALGLYLPLSTVRGTVGVLGVIPDDASGTTPAQRSYLEVFANQTALAFERTALAQEAQRAAIAFEEERLRSTLLSSVSHDLRTPIASIVGASSALLREQPIDEVTRRELLESIQQEGGRLDRQVRNLLDMTRLESGKVQLRSDWTPVDEVVGMALHRLEERLRGRDVLTDLAPDLPPVPMDGLLIETLVLNLLDNVLRHTPSGTPIEVAATATNGSVTITVADRGPGIPAGELEAIFEKFRRSPSGSHAGGTGLGLAICRAIALLHGGTIRAANRAGGGALFTLTLPLAPPPSLPPLPAATPEAAQ